MMHEDLLGYLLGALDPDEMQRVTQWLRDDPDARAQLAKIEQSLKPLQQHAEFGSQFDETLPPKDLISRTLNDLPPLPVPEAPVIAPMSSAVDTPTGSHRSWFDWAGGAVSIAILLGLLLPAMASGRLEARKFACQDHLHQFGTALTNFVNRSQQSRLPAVSESGPEAFAGVYAVRLKEVGLLEDADLRWCPSRDRPSRTQYASTELSTVVDSAALYRATVNQLKRIQRYAGGHYAYSLGVIDTNGFASPRFESRSSFAVMSDAPRNRTSQGSWDLATMGHGGTGINVLYEDGSVRFVSITSLDDLIDHPLRNHLGQGEAGVNVDDASLAPSWRPPFLHVRQR